MPCETTPAAVLSTHRLRLPAAAAGPSVREVMAEPARAGAAAAASLRRGLRRLASALVSVGAILAVVYAFPLVILAIGIPVALLVRLVLWGVGAL